MLSSLALAAPETHQLGPFTVSFDMNTGLQHQAQIREPIETPFYKTYSISITTDNDTGAGIGITEYKNLTDATLSMGKQIIYMDMALRGLNVTNPEDKTIDGKKGFVIVGTTPTNIEVYRGVYWLDSRDCGCGDLAAGNTNIVISSTYPQDVTMNLLNSLKVEKTGQAAQNSSSSDMPPSQ
jgi:hypothetical protein